MGMFDNENKSDFDLNAFDGLLEGTQVEQVKDFFDTATAAMDAQEVEQLAKESLDFLAGVSLPETCTALFPPIYQNIWALFLAALAKQTGVERYAIGLPRGHAKTVFLKLLCLYIILYTNRHFILVICATVDLASNFVSDVINMLKSPNIIAVYGDYSHGVQVENKELVRFKYRGRNIILKPIGSGSAVRGINVDNQRPDVEIFDDMQTRETAKSATQARELQQWMVGTVMKARDPKRCLYIYVGNMYASVPINEQKGITSCILENLKNNPLWKSWIVGAILEDGTALWPEVRSIVDLLEELESDRSLGEEEQFYAEVLNDPAAANLQMFDPSKVKPHNINLAESIPNGKFIIIDPSLNKSKSDSMPIAYCKVYDNIVYCDDLELTKRTPRLMVRHVISKAIKEGYFCIISEAQAMQELLLELFAEVLESLGLNDIELKGITGGGESKATRIMRGAKEITQGEVVLSPAVMSIYAAQFKLYQPAKQNNKDDVIDIAGYFGQVPLKFAKEIMSRDILMYNDEEYYYGQQSSSDSNFSIDTGFSLRD